MAKNLDLSLFISGEFDKTQLQQNLSKFNNQINLKINISTDNIKLAQEQIQNSFKSSNMPKIDLNVNSDKAAFNIQNVTQAISNYGSESQKVEKITTSLVNLSGDQLTIEQKIGEEIKTSAKLKQQTETLTQKEIDMIEERRIKMIENRKIEEDIWKLKQSQAINNTADKNYNITETSTAKSIKEAQSYEQFWLKALNTRETKTKKVEEQILQYEQKVRTSIEQELQLKNKEQSELQKSINLTKESYNLKLKLLQLKNPVIFDNNKVQESIFQLKQLTNLSNSDISGKGLSVWNKELGVGFQRIGNSVREVSTNLKNAHSETTTFTQGLLNATAKFTEWLLIGGVVVNSIRQIQNAIQYVRDIDTELTNLSKVVELTTSQLEEMKNVSIELGKELSRSSVEIAKSMAEFGRITKDVSEIQQLARVATMTANVSDMNAPEAAKALNSAMISFNLTAKDSMSILDKYNEIQNNFKSGLNDSADAVSVVGSAAKLAGMDLDQLLGKVTAMVSATGKSGNEIGTSIKTIISRVYRIGSEGEDDGGKAEELLKTLGIAVRDSNDEFRSLDTILGELNTKWGSFSNITKANIAQTIAGTYHYSKFIALMDNYQIAIDATNKAYNSQGSAIRENEKYINSAEGQIARTQVAVEELYNSLLSADVVKGFAGGLTVIVDSLTVITNIIGGFSAIVGISASALLAFNKNARDMSLALTSNIPIVGEISNKLSLWTNNAKENIKTQIQAINVTKQTIAVNKDNAIILAESKTRLIEQQRVLSGYKLGLLGVTIATVAFEAALTMGITWGISALIEGFDNWTNRTKKLQEALSTLSDTTKNLQEEVSTAESAINILNNSASSTSELAQARQDLIDTLGTGIIEAYDSEGKAILKNNKALETALELKKEETRLAKIKEKNKADETQSSLISEYETLKKTIKMRQDSAESEKKFFEKHYTSEKAKQLYAEWEDQLNDELYRQSQILSQINKNYTEYGSIINPTIEKDIAAFFAKSKLNDETQKQITNREYIASNYPQLLKYIDDEKKLSEEIAKVIAEENSEQGKLNKTLNASEDVYKNMLEANKDYVTNINTLYGVDLNNFKSLAEAKDAVNKELLQTMGSDWKEFYDFYEQNIDGLIEGQKLQTDETLWSIAQNTNPGDSANALKDFEQYKKQRDESSSRYNKIKTELELSKLDLTKFQTGISDDDKKDKKDVDNLDLKIDRLYEYNKALEDNQNLLDKNQAQQDISSESDKLKLQEQEIALLKQRQDILHNTNEERRKMQSELESSLGKSGFEFDNGSITNLNEQLTKLQNNANALTGDSKEKAIENVKKLQEQTEEYIKLVQTDMPSASEEWLKLYKTISEDSLDLMISGFTTETEKLSTALDDLNDKENLLADNDYIGKSKLIADQIKLQEQAVKEAERQFNKLNETTDEGIKSTDKYKDTLKDATEKLKDQNQQLAEGKKKQDDYNKSLIESYNKQLLDDAKDKLEAVKDGRQVIEDYYDDLLDNLEKEYNAQEKLNEANQLALDIEEAKQNLENTKNEKNTRIYTEGQGWIWDANGKNVATAEDNLEGLLEQQKKADAEKAYNDEKTRIESERDIKLEAFDAELKKAENHYKKMEELVNGGKDSLIDYKTIVASISPEWALANSESMQPMFDLMDRAGKYKNQLEGIDKLIKSIGSSPSNSITVGGSYANGGIIDYTGLAMVHGTPSRPEFVFNNDQIKTLINNMMSGKGSSTGNTSSTVIHVAKVVTNSVSDFMTQMTNIVKTS